MRRRTFLTGAAGLSLAGCAPPSLVAPAGSGVRLTHLKTWSPVEAALLIRLAGLKHVRPTHTVDAWRMLYPSHDSAGRPITLSGMIALPRGAAPSRLAAWLHGTTTSRDAVPSNLSGDGVAAALVFAGRGEAAIAPDYLGLGASPLVHTYLVGDDTARATIDMLAAARSLPGAPQGPPFLMGFSQGAHGCLATQATLEAAGQPVRGVAAVAGPHNLRTISLGAALAGGAASHSLYLAYLVRGYCARYGQPRASVLTPTATAQVATLFDSPHKPEEIMAALPTAPRELFLPDFLRAFDSGGDHWLLERIAANEVSHFAPRAPVRLYYGRDDRDVIPREAIATAAAMRAGGADITATDVGPYGHDPSMLHAAPYILAWMSQLPA